MTRADKDKPVVLSRIYTRTGDDGMTTLSDLSRTSKTDPRLAAYADVEEANAHLGLAMSHGSLSAELVAVLVRVQNELFDLGADLATPIAENPEFPPLRVEQSYVDWLEEQCDLFNEELKPLRSFILPGGDPATAALHLARVTVRRAERTTWAALEAHQDMNPLTARYLNRLSDLLFILCRVAHAGNEILWKPGGTR
jgi:cob(I)alamin adenosyltransferase